MLQTFETEYKRWRNLFLLCLGLAAASAFCMKWMEDELIDGNGNLFTILGLEFTYAPEKIQSIFAGLSASVQNTLRYHLSFDFVFMTGVYPGVLSICMMARARSRRSGWRKFLFIIAILQFIAWACDVLENRWLFEQLNNPIDTIEVAAFRMVVWIKWVLVLTGIFSALPFLLRPGRKS